jgi:hypothetical protein
MNRTTVPGTLDFKIYEMNMGMFGTILKGPRSGEHVFMSDCGRLVFLGSGGSVSIDASQIGEIPVRIEEKLLLERRC